MCKAIDSSLTYDVLTVDNDGQLASVLVRNVSLAGHGGAVYTARTWNANIVHVHETAVIVPHNAEPSTQRYHVVLVDASGGEHGYIGYKFYEPGAVAAMNSWNSQPDRRYTAVMRPTE